MSKAGGLRRIMREAKTMSEKPVQEFHAYPLEENVMEWHFTMMGPAESPYEGGLYHGRVLLPSDYPFAPPDVVLLTPNGRFELDKKICLSISSYHPENWHPTWGIATVLLALRDFMSTPGNNAIGACEYPKKEREKLAKESLQYVCPHCNQKPKDHWDESMSVAKPTAESDKPVIPEATPPKAETKDAKDASKEESESEKKNDPATPKIEASVAPNPQPEAAVEVVNDAEAPAEENAAPAAAPAVEAAVPPAPPVVADPPPRPRARPQRGVTLQISLSMIDKSLSFCSMMILLILGKKMLFDYYDTITAKLVEYVWQTAGN